MCVIIQNPVFKVLDSFYINISDTESAPLLSNGSPIGEFNPGWAPVFLYMGAKPVYILNLRHDNGSTADWFLDQDFNRVSGSFNDLPKNLKDIIIFQCRPFVEILLGVIAGASFKGVPSENVEALTFLSPETRIQIIGACAQYIIPNPRIINLTDLPVSVPFVSDLDMQIHSLKRSNIENIFATSILERLINSTDKGQLCFPDPVCGFDSPVKAFLCFDDFRYMYRFEAETTKLSFFIVVSAHEFRALALYIPTMGIIVTPDEVSGYILEERFPNLLDQFISQIAYMSPWILKAAERFPAKFASVVRGYPNIHIGHHLYNELGGIGELLSRAKGERIPDWFVFGYNIELWGALDELYPELQGKIHRDCTNLGDVIKFAYENDLCLGRVVATSVSEDDRRRILRVARNHRLFIETVTFIQEKIEGHRPVILLGLRVENRTIVNSMTFYSRLIAEVAIKFPTAVLVVDGKNSSESGIKIISNSEFSAVRPPYDVEKELAAYISSVGDAHNIMVIDNIGASLHESLAWCDRSTCFISIWGASLAKYRWVCNKIGLAITSNWNVKYRADLNIYNDPTYMESPTKLVIVPQELVQDEPENVPLINVPPGTPSLYNFSVNEEPFFKFVMQFLDEHIWSSQIIPEFSSVKIL